MFRLKGGIFLDLDFISDKYFFNPTISTLIESNSKHIIIDIIKKKQMDELENEITFEDKQIDLFIWNAVYIREILRKGTYAQNLHLLYNKFYRKILKASNINELQNLEVEIASAYLDLLIYDAEVTDSFIVNKMLQYLHLNIEAHTTVEDLANSLNISKGYASDCFKKHMGTTIMQYAKKIKVERAKTLLLNSTSSILEIASLLGFYDQSHFTKAFKELVGVTPTEFRNSHYL
ncbi:transcriptional regulator, AraC family [Clostridiales bacterium oral taxon 876 str. F0540]|nr:transcriptional regulator, AraC family [Clostridiales bacterium oral taxon 876 str. F0540]